MTATETVAVGTAESLWLDLNFEFIGRAQNLVHVDVKKSELVNVGRYGGSEKASLPDCIGLLSSVERVVRLTEIISAQSGSRWTVDLFEKGLQTNLTLEASDFAKSSVSILHYGSPLGLQIILAGLTVPGIGALFYGAKRLFALDLEFLAYREQRRIEYLEAKEIANELEERSTPKIDDQLDRPVQRSSRWRPTRGVIRDESG